MSEPTPEVSEPEAVPAPKPLPTDRDAKVGRAPKEKRWGTDLPGMPLTPFQNFIWKLAHEYPELTMQQLAEKSTDLGMHATRTGIEKALSRCRARLGVKAPQEMKRKAARKIPVRKIIAEINKDVLAAKFGRVAEQFVDSLVNLPRKDLYDINPLNRARIAAIAVENRQLLRGEPTAIVSHQDGRRAEEVAMGVLAELKRRGMKLEITPTYTEAIDVEVVPIAPEVKAIE